MVSLKKYAYHKHTGLYNLLKHVGKAMIDEIKNKGFETVHPYIEIYGHWINDETKLETALFRALQ